ncbi:hypothetical protein BT69DRAFT_1029718 [Atractiella rhizophila]|nr:hypothetical protein BT69DRAFT_1029718 [Atractiella rhizophila]
MKLWFLFLDSAFGPFTYLSHKARNVQKKSNMDMRLHPSWDSIVIQLSLLRIRDAERHNTIINQILFLTASNWPLNEETIALISSQQLEDSCPLSNTLAAPLPPSAFHQFPASEGNCVNFVDRTFQEEPHRPTSPAPSNTSMTPSASAQPLVPEDTSTNFVDQTTQQWQHPSASTTSTYASTSIPSDTSNQGRIRDDLTTNLVDLDSQEENSSSFPLEVFSHKIRAFPREPGYIRLQQGMNLYLQRETTRITQITETQYQASNPNHIFLPAHIYPTVLFRGDKVYPWSRGNLRSAWVYGIVFAHASSCRCGRGFMWFREAETKGLEAEENDDVLALPPFPKSPAQLRSHAKHCTLGEILPEFVRVLEVISSRQRVPARLNAQ